MRFLCLILFLGISLRAVAQPEPREFTYRRFFPGAVCDAAAFNLAVRGYGALRAAGLLANDRYLSIIDFTKPSNVPRFFVLDTRKKRVVLTSITAHGVGSDPDSSAYAQRFSNRDGSRASSLGFYITGDTYTNHRPLDSLGLCLFGLEKGYNDSAAAREIVIHYGATERRGTVYVTDTGAGRSYGCPALPLRTNTAIIELIKGGSCLFVYSNRDRGYAEHSAVLNGKLRDTIVQRGPPPNNCSCNLRRKQ